MKSDHKAIYTMKDQNKTSTILKDVQKNFNAFYPGLLIITCFLLIEHVVIINTFIAKYTTNEQRLPSNKIGSSIIFNQEAIPLPSIKVQFKSSEANTTSLLRKREEYGGKGDGYHLGGFLELDCNSLSPNTWKLMMEKVGIKSVVDVGCGRGISTSFFSLQGIESTCVEGSHDAIVRSVLPPKNIVEHDYSRGPWWPKNTVDAIWCVEFLEHVGRNFHRNIFPTFKKAALIFASHSNWGGWHHVEIHDDDWWITKFESQGFVHSKYLSKLIRNAALDGMKESFPNGRPFHAQHIWLSMQVFINPAVSSLPEHDHLFTEVGCGKSRKTDIGRECGEGEETPLPAHYKPLIFDNDKFQQWQTLIMNSINQTSNML